MPKLDAVVKVGNEVIQDRHTKVDRLNLPWIVQDVNGEWLWVGAHRKGYVHRSQVVTLDDAPAYYTNIINGSRRNVWAYHCRGIAWRLNGELDLAIADFNEELSLEPTARTYISRGNALTNKKEYGKAISDFDKAILLDPTNASAYHNRGAVWVAKNDLDNAMSDYNEAIRLKSSYVEAYRNRGNVYELKKEFDKAVYDYEQATRLDPNYSDAYNSFAWLLATCPRRGFRNGERGVELATKACELTNWRDANSVDTLAAAYAEAGDFGSAIHYETKAVELRPTDAKFVKEAKERLALYIDRKPYRKEQ